MNTVAKVTQTELLEFLLNVAIVRPVFIWGAPGIGKSSLVQSFAQQLGMPCVSLLGSQLAPEDLIGVPQIVGAAAKSQVLHRGLAAERPGLHVIELEAPACPAPSAIVRNERALALVPQVDLARHRCGNVTAPAGGSSGRLRSVATPLAADSESLLDELALVGLETPLEQSEQVSARQSMRR